MFEDYRGTCFTKHGAIARLAQDLHLNVFKNLGFYRLNGAIVTGIDGILQPYGLSFIPQIHCFLDYGHCRIDLTEGNRTCKNITITEYDFVIRVDADSTRDELERTYFTYFERYASVEPKLASIGRRSLVELLKACNQQMNNRSR